MHDSNATTTRQESPIKRVSQSVSQSVTQGKWCGLKDKEEEFAVHCWRYYVHISCVYLKLFSEIQINTFLSYSYYFSFRIIIFRIILFITMLLRHTHL